MITSEPIGELPAAVPDRDPIVQFEEWFAFAKQTNIYLPEAMTLATATPDGSPSARIVLLKQISSEGFVFFTNYESRKGHELASNPRAALVLHWAILERQIRVEGSIEQISQKESEAYFESRPRGSCIGAWASRQSQKLDNRSELEERVLQFENAYAGRTVPLPPNWGGFRVIPERLEFWQGRKSRLHERLIFTKRSKGNWDTHLLFP